MRTNLAVGLTVFSFSFLSFLFFSFSFLSFLFFSFSFLLSSFFFLLSSFSFLSFSLSSELQNRVEKLEAELKKQNEITTGLTNEVKLLDGFRQQIKQTLGSMELSIDQRSYSRSCKALSLLKSAERLQI